MKIQGLWVPLEWHEPSDAGEALIVITAAANSNFPSYFMTAETHRVVRLTSHPYRWSELVKAETGAPIAEAR